MANNAENKNARKLNRELKRLRLEQKRQQDQALEEERQKEIKVRAQEQQDLASLEKRRQGKTLTQTDPGKGAPMEGVSETAGLTEGTHRQDPKQESRSEGTEKKSPEERQRKQNFRANKNQAREKEKSEQQQEQPEQKQLEGQAQTKKEKQDGYNKQTADNQPLGDVASRRKGSKDTKDRTGREEVSTSSVGKTPNEKKRQKKLKTEQKKDGKKKGGKSKEKDSLMPEKTGKTDVIGKILFGLLFVFAILIDILPFVTVGISAAIDWILDGAFWISIAIVLFVITGDVIGSMLGKKGAINIIQTVAEFLPVIDVLPIHTVALIIIYLDLEYDILSKVGKLKKMTKT